MLTGQSYEQHLCLAGTGTARVKSIEPFRILALNFGKRPKTLLPNQTIAEAKPRPTALMESNVPRVKFLGIPEGKPLPLGMNKDRKPLQKVE